VKEILLKRLVRHTLFPNGTIRKIRFGPLAGNIYRVSDITGMSAWYSGPEWGHQRAFESLVREGDTVIDIGANWGMHTIFLSRRVGATGRVIAVEPEARALNELVWHLDANKCDNVKVYRCAVGDRIGMGSFVATESAYTSHLAAGEADSGGIPVQITTIDSLVFDERIQQLRLVKIDVEGAEASVLAGSAKTLREARPFFIIDLHTPKQDVAVAQILREAGYELCRIDGSLIKHSDRGWPDPDGVWGSVLAKPIAC
jgi:FkbM family methyltransferase